MLLNLELESSGKYIWAERYWYSNMDQTLHMHTKTYYL